jgi:hypothetical protein
MIIELRHKSGWNVHYRFRLCTSIRTRFQQQGAMPEWLMGMTRISLATKLSRYHMASAAQVQILLASLCYFFFVIFCSLVLFATGEHLLYCMCLFHLPLNRSLLRYSFCCFIVCPASFLRRMSAAQLHVSRFTPKVTILYCTWRRGEFGL